MNFIIYNDGVETTVTPMTNDQLEALLRDGWLSNKEYIFTDVPKDTATTSWNKGVLIIRGRVYNPEE